MSFNVSVCAGSSLSPAGKPPLLNTKAITSATCSGFIGPRPAIEQRHTFRVEPAQFAIPAEARRFGNLRVQRIDLRLQVALRLHRVLPRAVADSQRRQARQRLRERDRRRQERNENGSGKDA